MKTFVMKFMSENWKRFRLSEASRLLAEAKLWVGNSSSRESIKVMESCFFLAKHTIFSSSEMARHFMFSSKPITALSRFLERVVFLMQGSVSQRVRVLSFSPKTSSLECGDE